MRGIKEKKEKNPFSALTNALLLYSSFYSDLGALSVCRCVCLFCIKAEESLLPFGLLPFSLPLFCCLASASPFVRCLKSNSVACERGRKNASMSRGNEGDFLIQAARPVKISSI